MNVVPFTRWLRGELKFSVALLVSMTFVSSPLFAEESVIAEGQRETLVQQKGDTLGIEVINAGDATQVVLGTTSDTVQLQESRLTNPDRLVIDITGQRAALSRVFDTQKSSQVERVRLGAHPDKSRVVFDLRPGSKVTTDVQREGKNVIVTLASSGAAPQERAQPRVVEQQAAAVAPAVNPATLEEPEPVAVAAEERAQEPLPQKVEITKPVPASEIQDGEAAQPNMEEPVNPATGPKLSNLRIEPLDETSNIVVAEMNTAGFYTFTKSAPSEYVLRLEGASLTQDASQTLISPPGAGQIRTVRPVIEGSDVLVRIFSAPTAMLRARSNGNKIIVSSFNLGADDIRAQAAPEGMTKEEGKTEAKPDAAGAPAAPATSGEITSEEVELAALLADQPTYSGRLISLDLADTDIDNALRIIAEVSNLNIIASDEVSGKVTLRLVDVPWDQALDVILKTNGLDKVQEGNVIRIAPVDKLRAEREALRQARQAEEELEPLQVRYIRISYAKAAELQPLVETVLTERGTVAFDERTNQIIIKDISKGVKNAAILAAKLDLRTPQVLIETQIVEAERTFARDLGTELGFNFIASPATGNATGYNFPNSVQAVGSIRPGESTASSFPAAVTSTAGSAFNLLFGSADGTKTVNTRLTALESEGRVRIVSRPSVAVTNNTAAEIKSVTKIRIKVPSGGLSVATGSGAQSNSSTGVAAEVVEVGIVLNVTAHASPDYFVLMDLNAKSSTLGNRGDAVDGIPPEVERSATSTILVSSGQTFALGGIYKITDDDGVTGVPFLKDVPFFGYLFRNQSVNNSDEELIFFVTPRIIEGSFDDAAMKSSVAG